MRSLGRRPQAWKQVVRKFFKSSEGRGLRTYGWKSSAQHGGKEGADYFAKMLEVLLNQYKPKRSQQI